jgi:hypothetical protein
MAKTLTAYLARKRLERELFGARQRLIDLIELYDSGLWRRLYKKKRPSRRRSAGRDRPSTISLMRSTGMITADVPGGEATRK